MTRVKIKNPCVVSSVFSPVPNQNNLKRGSLYEILHFFSGVATEHVQTRNVSVGFVFVLMEDLHT